jgi:hypothetical protein
LHSKETKQYIRKLEGETERLGKLVKDINAQLHASKVRVSTPFHTVFTQCFTISSFPCPIIRLPN